MKESVIYQDVFQKGERTGEQKEKEPVRFCLRLLNQLFAKIDSEIVERVKVLPVEKL